MIGAPGQHLPDRALKRAGIFFKGELMAFEKPPDRASTSHDPSVAKHCYDLEQGQIRLLGHEVKHHLGVLLEWRDATPGWHCCNTARFLPALNPFYGRARADFKEVGC